ncbi:MAG: phosphoenolpyruvate synthase [Candidatus Nezhaarchaeota archaeon]|nr:phosphoenolpyruvate synthase [Candidatus Nezhaarchaeota archaeon]
MSEQFILWFEQLGKHDIAKAGGKGANLGEMLRAGIPVPPGFVVTAQAYQHFIEKADIKDKIYQVIKEKIKHPDDPREYEEVSTEIRGIIESTPIPPEVEEAIRLSYRELSARIGVGEAYVAVRSSATAEDLPDASFAGQQETYLNVRGEEELLRKVVKCWSSLFTPRAIFYRQQKGFPHEKVLMSVVIQKMVNSKSAGVIFTIHPVTGDHSKIVIEGSWGLGEGVVSGSVTPDRFIVDKSTLKIVEEQIAEKVVEYVHDPETGRTVRTSVPPERRKQPCLSPEEVKVLAELAIKIENHYGRPQDIEWAIDRDLPFPSNVFIVQSRPETIWGLKAPSLELRKDTIAPALPLVKGLPASPGIAFGVARVALSPEELASSFKKGDILVTKMTNPDWVPFMRMASSIVTDDGGMTCHAAIVSRELGIPAIVGTGNATKLMKTGGEYTVDARVGVVYEGKVDAILSETKPSQAPAALTVSEARGFVQVTGTKILMNLGVPEKISEYRNLPFDGIGLMRIEFIMASWIGEHPLYLIETKQEKKFVDKLAEGIAMVAREIYPRPVVVRLSDFKTNEYRQLKGGEKYEPHEDNPMLGWRGVSRYISPQYREAFKLELKAIKKVRDEMGLRNVWVMLPFVRTTWEVEEVLKLMEEEGLRRGRDFKVWAMVEVPSVIFMAEEFCRYFDGFSIGSNDLTQLILGTDRDSQILPEIDPRYFDERDPAVKRAIEYLIKIAHRHGVTVSICGQGPSVYPEFTEFLVRCGIDSISVNPDVVAQTRHLVASVEMKIILERLAQLKVERNFKRE